MKRALLFVVVIAALLAPSHLSAQGVVSKRLTTTTCPGTGCLELNVEGYGSASVYLVVEGTGTAVVEVSMNGVNWSDAVSAGSVTGSGNVTSMTATGGWTVNVAGWTAVRVRLTDATNPVVAMLQASRSGGGAGGGAGGGGGDASAANQSTQITSLQLIDNLPLAEDGVHASGETGLLSLGVRNDAGTALAADGDRIPFSMDANGAVRVTGGGGGVQYTEGDTDATITGSVLMLEAAANEVVAAPGTAADGLLVNLGANNDVIVSDGAGALNVIVDSSATLTVTDGAGAMNVICDSGCAGGTQFAEDIAHTGGDNGTMLLAVRNDAGTALAGTTGDYIPLSTDSSGALRVVGSSGTTQFAEDLAHTSTDSTVFIAGIRRDTTPSSSAGTAGDYTAFNIDANGRLYVNATLYDAAGAALVQDTQGTHGTTLGTITSVTGGIVMGNASTATPTAVGADGDAAAFWLTQNGALNVADGGGTLTVDGTVTVTDGAGALNTIVDSGTITTVSTVTNLSQLGTVALPVEDVAETAAGVGIYAMGVRRDTAASSAGTAGDNTMASYDSLGRLWTRAGNPCADHARLTTAAINTTTSGNVEVVALNGSDLIYVCGFSIVETAAQSAQLIYGTGTACATGETDLTGPWAFGANGGITQANAGVPQFVVPAGNAFCIETDGTGQTSGHVTYVRTAAP